MQITVPQPNEQWSINKHPRNHLSNEYHNNCLCRFRKGKLSRAVILRGSEKSIIDFNFSPIYINKYLQFISISIYLNSHVRITRFLFVVYSIIVFYRSSTSVLKKLFGQHYVLENCIVLLLYYYHLLIVIHYMIIKSANHSFVVCLAIQVVSPYSLIFFCMHHFIHYAGVLLLNWASLFVAVDVIEYTSASSSSSRTLSWHYATLQVLLIHNSSEWYHPICFLICLPLTNFIINT